MSAPWFSARRWRTNWYRSWTLGRVEFDLEWVPKARYYTFSLTIGSPANSQQEPT